MFGRYPSSFAANCTFCTVFADAEAPGVKTLLTADLLTPARIATSAEVTLLGENVTLIIP